MCCYKGRWAANSKVDKIRNWGLCNNLSEVQAFLGTTGLMQIFIKNFSLIAWPLTCLTHKDTKFVFGTEEMALQEKLKAAIVSSPAIWAIDYNSEQTVYLSVDTSYIPIGYFLAQQMPGSDTKCYPSCFGSMLLNKREENYSQPKLELYGLFCSLRATRLYIIGVKKLVVEVNAKYIRGMLNNPDIQPNTTINRWIAGILLFNFKLVHIPSATHGPDGLSCQLAQPDDPPKPEDNYEDWIDRAYRFMHIINPTTVNQGSHLVLSLFRLTNAEAPADSFRWPLTTNFIHRIQAVPTNIVNTTPDFTPLIITNPTKEHIPCNNHQNKANLKLNLVVTLLWDTYRPTGMIDQDFKRLIRFPQDFFLKGNVLWRKGIHGHRKVIIPPVQRLSLITQAHDYVGHHGVYPVWSHLIERFWWLHLQSDVKWFEDSCHVCQTWHYQKNNIPPTVAMPATLFGKVYIDMMFMPKAGGFGYVVHACCSISSYPKARMLRSENHKTLADFIFQNILCRWGAIQTIVTNNGKPFIAALNSLAKWYGINHIRISGYNTQANGLVEHKRWDLWQALYKITNSVESKWHWGFYATLWAECIMPRQTMGYSPYFAAHSLHPILPFDIDKATYLLPPPNKILTTKDLIVRWARQLQCQLTDINNLCKEVHQARLENMHRFVLKHPTKIKNYKFTTGDLVLVRNTAIKKSLDRKMRPQYLGPYIVISRNTGGTYILAKLDGTVLKNTIGAFRVIPYHPWKVIALPNIFDIIDITRTELWQREQLNEEDDEFNAEDWTDSNE
jgi:hypothetical protein